MNIIKKYQALPVQVRASGWFLICAFLQKGISVLTTPIFTRILSTAEYGQYSVFNSWLGIITIIVTLNLHAGVYTTGLVKFSNERAKYSSSLQGLTLTLCLFWSGVYWCAHTFWNSVFGLTTVQMSAMLLLIWTSAVFLFWATEQRVDYKYRKLVIVTLLVSFAKPVLGIILVLNADDKVTARIIGLLIVELIGYTWAFVDQMSKGRVYYSKSIWLYALKFNIPLIPHYLSTVVLNNSDRIMISNMVGSDEAGIYSLAYSLSLIMTLFNTAIQQTMIPWMYQKIHDQKGQEIKKVAYPAMMLIAGLNLLLIMLAPEVVRIFAPSSYYDAIYVIPPVAMSVFFLYVYNVFVPFEFYFEKTKYIAVSSVAAAALNLLLNYIFIGIFGYKAAGYTTLACYILLAAFHYMFMKKVCRDNLTNPKVFELRVIVLISIIFMAIGFVFMALYSIAIARYLLAGVCVVVLIIKRKYIMQLIRKMLALRKKSTD